MDPQEHYEQSERLAGNAISSDLPLDELMFTVGLAQVHATLALAGFTRDAATVAEAAASPPLDTNLGHPSIPCACGHASYFVPSKGRRG